MTKGDELLTPIDVKGYNPLTFRKKVRIRKIELRDIIQKQIDKKGLKIEKIRNRCKGKPLAIIVDFNLLKSEEEGTSKKDLDNLVGVFCDILSEYIIKNTTDDDLKGLGFVKDDEMIYEIHCTKKIVKKQENMGFTISIFESSFE